MLCLPGNNPDDTSIEYIFSLADQLVKAGTALVCQTHPVDDKLVLNHANPGVTILPPAGRVILML